MANAIRGECEVTFGDRKFVVALTMATLAELEAAFSVDWDQVGEQLWRRVDDGKKAVPIPRIGPLLKFWRAVFKVHAHDFAAVDAVVSPFELMTEALKLMSTANATWFGSDREPTGNETPLAARPDGAIGSASGSAGSA